MVDRGAVPGVERVVRSFGAGRGRPAAGTGGAVCRLCGVAEEVDGGRRSARAGRVLEREPGGRAGVAGTARGPSAAGAAGLRGSDRWVGAERGADGGVEGAEPTAWDDVIYD